MTLKLPSDRLELPVQVLFAPDFERPDPCTFAPSVLFVLSAPRPLCSPGPPRRPARARVGGPERRCFGSTPPWALEFGVVVLWTYGGARAAE
eukprot:11286361-Alexandrium_andersonii.AAC.1